jgi:hypothetical protein
MRQAPGGPPGRPPPTDPTPGGPGHPPPSPPLIMMGPGRPPSVDRLVGLLSQVDQLLLAAQHDAATARWLAASSSAPPPTSSGRRPPPPPLCSAEETDGGAAARSRLEDGAGGAAEAADIPLNERLLALYAAETLKETRRLYIFVSFFVTITGPDAQTCDRATGRYERGNGLGGLSMHLPVPILQCSGSVTL